MIPTRLDTSAPPAETEPIVIRYRRPKLYAKQAAAIFARARYAVIEASTKSGKTHGCIAWIVEQAVMRGGENRHFWWIAPSFRQARIAYRRTKLALRKLPGVAYNDSAPWLRLPNGGMIWFLSGENPDNLYGEDVYAAVIDEGTRTRATVWTAVRTTLTATEGPIRVIGNVNGIRNWVWRLARKAEERMRANDPAWHYARLTIYDARDAGIISDAEIIDARGTLTEAEFSELYLAVPAKTLALIYAPFNATNITERADYLPDAGPIYIAYDWGFTDPTAILLCQYRDGTLHVFDELYGSGRSEADWVQEVVRRVIALPGYEGPTYEEWGTSWRDGKSPKQWPNLWPDLAAGDPSAVQLRAEFNRRGIGARKPKYVKHAVTSGQDVLRALIETADEQRHLFVHPRCTHLIEGFENLRATEHEDGSFAPRPDPAPDNHAYSHAPDAMRYLAWATRRMFNIGSPPQEGEYDAA